MPGGKLRLSIPDMSARKEIAMYAIPSLRTRCVAALLACVGVVFCLGGTLFLMHLAVPLPDAATIETAQSSPEDGSPAAAPRRS
jgi:hypothetical protein